MSRIQYVIGITTLSLIFSGCSQATTKPVEPVQQTQTQETQKNTIKGYISKFDTGAMFLRYTNTSGKLTGQLSISLTAENGTQSAVSTHPFDGVLSKESITITYTGKNGDRLSGQVWTGELKGKNLNLLVTNDDGTMMTIPFTEGTVDDYNNIIAGLNSTIAVNKENVDRQATISKIGMAIEQDYKDIIDNGDEIVKLTNTTSIATQYNEVVADAYSRYQEFNDTVAQYRNGQCDKGIVETRIGSLETCVGTIEVVNNETNNRISDIRVLKTKQQQLFDHVRPLVDQLVNLEPLNASNIREQRLNIINTASKQIASAETTLISLQKKATTSYNTVQSLINTTKQVSESLK